MATTSQPTKIVSCSKCEKSFEKYAKLAEHFRKEHMGKLSTATNTTQTARTPSTTTAASAAGEATSGPTPTPPGRIVSDGHTDKNHEARGPENGKPSETENSNVAVDIKSGSASHAKMEEKFSATAPPNQPISGNLTPLAAALPASPLLPDSNLGLVLKEESQSNLAARIPGQEAPQLQPGQEGQVFEVGLKVIGKQVMVATTTNNNNNEVAGKTKPEKKTPGRATKKKVSGERPDRSGADSKDPDYDPNEKPTPTTKRKSAQRRQPLVATSDPRNLTSGADASQAEANAGKAKRVRRSTQRATESLEQQKLVEVSSHQDEQPQDGATEENQPVAHQEVGHRQAAFDHHERAGTVDDESKAASATSQDTTLTIISVTSSTTTSTEPSKTGLGTTSLTEIPKVAAAAPSTTTTTPVSATPSTTTTTPASATPSTTITATPATTSRKRASRKQILKPKQSQQE